MSGWVVRCNPRAGEFEIDAPSEAVHDGVVVAADSGAADLAQTIAEATQCASPPGVCAAARWNADSGRVELIRDRTGLHPLFYLRPDGNSIVAATDLRALARSVEVGPDPAAVAAWLSPSAESNPAQTLLAGVKRVPAGHVLALDRNGCEVYPSWQPPRPGSLPAETAARFGDALEGAVRRYSRLGNPAIFLSGGIDSASIAAAAPSAVALCVEFEGASERGMQQLVASSLSLHVLESKAEATTNLVERALSRAQESLWPTTAIWAPVFDDLAARARNAGAGVLLDGIGGDELLDAGYAAGRLLWSQPRGLFDWLRAERRYTGGLRSSLRSLVKPPLGYAAERAADFVDAELAAQREETFDRGMLTGLPHRHPMWDPEVVELLNGLPPRALVAGGHPKSPARSYLAARIPGFGAPWPRPAVADNLLVALERHLRPFHRATEMPRLRALGIPVETRDTNLPTGKIWRMLCMEHWLEGVESWGDD